MKETASFEVLIKPIRWAIWLLTMVVFLGYTMIWIMNPTKMYYTAWLPQILEKTNSTYFGKQGASTLIYTFPFLFMAVLSCLYLHLGKKYADPTMNCKVSKPRLASWKRPVIVKGPLGIVSWMELSFLNLFIALLLWSLSSYLRLMFFQISQQTAPGGEQEWKAKLEYSGLALGLVGNICLAFLFFPVTRGSSVLQLFGLTSEASIKYHIWVGHIALILFTAHGLCYIIFWSSRDQMSEIFKWDKVGVSNLAGAVALLPGLAMWVTSLPCIRRKIFELFFYTHYLYFFFVVFYVFHVGFSSSCIILPGFYLFLIDRYLRFLQSQQRVRLVSARILPCETVELNFSKSPVLSYNPTSIIFVNVPVISKLQWHPFTVTSSSNTDPETLSIVIKSEGSWSSELYQKLSSSSSTYSLEISVEGPYGPAATHFLRRDMLVMVSGGSGITPFISIIRELLFTASKSGRETPRVLLICAFKKYSELSMLELLLPVSGITADSCRLQLQVEAYVTREKEPASHKQLIRAIRFKANASDAPISAILGPNSWFWLGAIIISSFALFLVLVGILTRYYVYPIDHNSNTIFASASRAALNMVFVCVSVAITATVAFLWNKKQNSKEMRQIHNMEAPTTSPGSWFYNGDRELESLPAQSLLQATRVYSGKRPNLRTILLGCEGTSVGVLVSGPTAMKHEVGAICSSGVADNLHFESMSFRW